MNMLGFVYLVLILGWIMIVLFLKCKKTIAPTLGFGDNYMDSTNVDRRLSVHVIELPIDEIENEDRRLDSSYNQQCNTLRRHSQRSQNSGNDEHMIERITYPTDAIINPAFTSDEDYIINAPPPSYDEVMRQPEIYPKVHQTCKSSDAQI